MEEKKERGLYVEIKGAGCDFVRQLAESTGKPAGRVVNAIIKNYMTQDGKAAARFVACLRAEVAEEKGRRRGGGFLDGNEEWKKGDIGRRLGVHPDEEGKKKKE